MDTTGSFTIDEWCRYRRISRAKAYQLWQAGKGPRRLRVGARVTITREADDEWRREREIEAAGDDARAKSKLPFTT